MHDEIMGLLRFYAVGLSACFVGWVLMVGMARGLPPDVQANNDFISAAVKYAEDHGIAGSGFRGVDRPPGVYRVKFVHGWRSNHPKAARACMAFIGQEAARYGFTVVYQDETFQESFPPEDPDIT